MKSEYELTLWKDVPGYEGYYKVSNEGEIANSKTGKKLKPRVHPKGYLRVNLLKDGELKTFTVHRLVAMAFLPNPVGYPQVNHKDENKANNRIENLEWCEGARNLSHGTRNRRIKSSYSRTREAEDRAEKLAEIAKEALLLPVKNNGYVPSAEHRELVQRLKGLGVEL